MPNKWSPGCNCCDDCLCETEVTFANDCDCVESDFATIKALGDATISISGSGTCSGGACGDPAGTYVVSCGSRYNASFTSLNCFATSLEIEYAVLGQEERIQVTLQSGNGSFFKTRVWTFTFPENDIYRFVLGGTCTTSCNEIIQIKDCSQGSQSWTSDNYTVQPSAPSTACDLDTYTATLSIAAPT